MNKDDLTTNAQSRLFAYWFLYPFRNSYKNKLKALLEGLETQNVDKLIKEGKTGDFRNYGKAYVSAVKDKIESARNL